MFLALRELAFARTRFGLMGAVVAASRPVTVVTVVLGAAVLLTYAAMAARRAVRGDDALVVDGAPDRTAGTAAAAALTTLALTWLNPHVYLDTVVLLGSVAAGHGDARWWFAAGAGVGSVLWFTALGYGARLLRPVFARPAAWRLLDAVIAVVMVGIATGLLADLRAP